MKQGSMLDKFGQNRVSSNPKQRWEWIVLFGLAGCTASADVHEDESKKPVASGIRVEVIHVGRSSFDDRLESTGSLEADADVTLSARAAGTLLSLAPLGKRVKKGAIVAEIDPGIPVSGVQQAKATREAAVADLALAKENYVRQKPLYEKGVISAIEFQRLNAEYAQSRARLAQATAALLQAKEAVENTKLVTPFEGIVDQHFVDRGEQVNPGAAVLRVLDASTLIVKAGLPERYAADIQEGAPVEVRFPAYRLEPRTGRVRFVATAIDPRSRTFDVEVTLDNQDGRLKPEMVAKLIVTRAQLKDALVVPQAAVMRDELGLHVFIVEGELEGPKIARRRSVQTTGRSNGNVVISGVEEGSQVVVLGQTKLIDGDLVTVTDQKVEVP